MFSPHFFLVSLICTLPAFITAAPSHALLDSAAASDHATPGSSADAASYSVARCTAALKSVENGDEKQKTCYPFSSLYHTPPKQICSCLDQTVNASKKVAGRCTPKRDAKAPHKFSKNDIYAGWSNSAAANAACSKSKQGNTCIEQIPMINQIVQLGEEGADLPNKIGCEEPCFKQLYKACDGKGDLAPTLYFYGGEMTIQDVFDSWKKHCKWDEQE